jgi:hypothetical protein
MKKKVLRIIFLNPYQEKKYPGQDRVIFWLTKIILIIEYMIFDTINALVFPAVRRGGFIKPRGIIFLIFRFFLRKKIKSDLLRRDKDVYCHDSSGQRSKNQTRNF